MFCNIQKFNGKMIGGVLIPCSPFNGSMHVPPVLSLSLPSLSFFNFNITREPQKENRIIEPQYPLCTFLFFIIIRFGPRQACSIFLLKFYSIFFFLLKKNCGV